MFKNVVVVLGLALVSATCRAQAPAQGTDVVAPAVPVADTAPTNVEAYIKAESKGGELDFSKLLANKKQSMFLHEGNMYTKQEFALVLWGMRVKSLGLESAERACALYAAVNQRPLSGPEKQAVTNGFASGTRE